jgi:hypothetical protein
VLLLSLLSLIDISFLFLGSAICPFFSLAQQFVLTLLHFPFPLNSAIDISILFLGSAIYPHSSIPPHSLSHAFDLLGFFP